MAVVWKSRGTVGPGSLGAGKSLPLDVLERRLKDFRTFCHGERPKTMLPQSREHYVHVMIEVTDDDPQPRPDRFPGQGSTRLSEYARVRLDFCSSQRISSTPEMASPRRRVW